VWVYMLQYGGGIVAVRDFGSSLVPVICRPGLYVFSLVTVYLLRLKSKGKSQPLTRLLATKYLFGKLRNLFNMSDDRSRLTLVVMGF
jgi:hypothetical protein